MNSYNGFSGELRQRSWTWAKAEIKAGRQAPASKCCACGQTEGPLDYHCEDYSEPFGPHIFEFPMCFVCHMMVHCRFRNTEAWKRYREAIAAGIMLRACSWAELRLLRFRVPGQIWHRSALRPA